MKLVHCQSELKVNTLHPIHRSTAANSNAFAKGQSPSTATDYLALLRQYPLFFLFSRYQLRSKALLKLWPAERRASDGGMRQGLRLNPVDSEASLDRRPDLPSPAKGNAVTPILSMKDYSHIARDTALDWSHIWRSNAMNLTRVRQGRQGVNHKAFLHSPGTATSGSILVNYRSLPLILSAILRSRTDYK